MLLKICNVLPVIIPQQPEDVDITQVFVLPGELSDQGQGADGLQFPHHLHTVCPEACFSPLPQTHDTPGASPQIGCTLILRPPFSDQSTTFSAACCGRA